MERFKREKESARQRERPKRGFLRNTVQVKIKETTNELKDGKIVSSWIYQRVRKALVRWWILLSVYSEILIMLLVWRKNVRESERLIKSMAEGVLQ